MNREIEILEERVMRHLGNNLAYELALIALIDTHPAQHVLLNRMLVLRKQYTELVEGSIMMVDDVSPKAEIAVNQMNKMLDRLIKRSVEPSVDT